MANELTNFNFQVPAYAKNKESKAMQAMGGGITGGGFGNRLSLRSSKFRLVQNGSEVEVLQAPFLDVVIFALSNSVQRMYFEGAYESDSKERPTCFSHDGITPSSESAKVQSTKCAICPQNIKGSGRMAGTKACAYKKRVIILPPDDLEGAPYSLDVSGQSMFGEQVESQNKFNFKGYFEKLSAHSVAIDAIVTRLAFDDAASVPKLHFSPVRVLTKDEYDVILKRVEDDDVQKMLKDLTNEVEVEAFEIQKSVPAPVVIEAPKPVPEPKKRGFGSGTATPKAAPQQVITQAGPNGSKSITIDLDDLKNFDDDK